MVNTFVPTTGFIESNEILDDARLGKQRSEVKIMLAGITGIRFKRAQGEHGITLPDTRGYQNHSATRMWREAPLGLALFGIYNCEVWADRFGHDLRTGKGADTLADMKSWYDWLKDNGNTKTRPDWWGDERVHSTHRAVLLSKDFEYYSQFGWSEAPSPVYYWPR